MEIRSAITTLAIAVAFAVICVAAGGCGASDDAAVGLRAQGMGFGGGDDPEPPGSDVPPPVSTYLTGWRTRVSPNDIAVSPVDRTIAVVDAGNDSVELLLRGGTHYRYLRGFVDPRSAAYLPDGRLLVGDAGRGAVCGFDRAGREVLTLGQGDGEFTAPNDIALHPTEPLVYVADSGAASVFAYSLGGAEGVGEPAFTFEAGHLTLPIALAVSAPAQAGDVGEVFVGDAGRRTIEVFGADDGAWLRSFDRPGTGAGELSVIGGLLADESGRLYVLEPIGGFVQMFDRMGGYIGRIGEHGGGPGQLRSPKAVTIDPFRRLLVTSFLDHRIEVWGLDGHEAPADDVIAVQPEARPGFLSAQMPRLMVAVDLPLEAATVLHDSFLLAGAVPPLEKPRLTRIGKRVWRAVMRFPTEDVLATLPVRTPGDVTLTLTALTPDGRLVRGDFVVTVVVTRGATRGLGAQR